jgi:hypothetical protein
MWQLVQERAADGPQGTRQAAGMMASVKLEASLDERITFFCL